MVINLGGGGGGISPHVVLANKMALMEDKLQNMRGEITEAWGGHMHPVPESFQFPLCDVHTLWDLWIDGKKSQKMQPYRFLKGFDLTDNKQRTRLSKARTLMKKLLDLAEKTVSEIALLAAGERDALFTRIYKSLWLQLHPNSNEEYYSRHRAETQIFTSLYDTM